MRRRTYGLAAAAAFAIAAAADGCRASFAAGTAVCVLAGERAIADPTAAASETTTRPST
jgi:hypothetical protein